MQETLEPARTEEVAPFLQQLKTATADLHDNLENTALSKSLMNETVTVKDYQDYLLAMESVIAFSELYIQPMVAPQLSQLPPVSKLAAIQHDMHVLNTDASEREAILFNPVEKDFTTAFALGYFYVVEGSMLGGRFISNHINSRLGINEHNGGSFFTGYGAETGKHWKSLLNDLSAYAVQNNAAAEIIAGARHAFTAIYDHFSKMAACR